MQEQANDLFDFEKLEVYKRAIGFINTIFKVNDEFPNRIQYSLGDQLRRASLAIANNIAEGNDKKSLKDKIKFYEYSLDSARECIPMLTITKDQKLLTEDIHNNLRNDCTIICKMLRNLINSVH